MGGGERQWPVTRAPTHWAWRQDDILAKLRLVGSRSNVSRRANYSAFAVVHLARDLIVGKLDGAVQELVSLSHEPSHAAQLRAMRAALGRAAPLMCYAPRDEPCDEPPCDAFAALAATVQAIGVSVFAEQSDNSTAPDT
mmetsp:Transcript_50148/g.138928  ORF Transcript_50148/g.138928 Transcript_50148/m.138928 type:complete len:139 (-) Transcript_50148:176-592(-)